MGKRKDLPESSTCWPIISRPCSVHSPAVRCPVCESGFWQPMLQHISLRYHKQSNDKEQTHVGLVEFLVIHSSDSMLIVQGYHNNQSHGHSGHDRSTISSIQATTTSTQLMCTSSVAGVMLGRRYGEVGVIVR